MQTNHPPIQSPIDIIKAILAEGDKTLALLREARCLVTDKPRNGSLYAYDELLPPHGLADAWSNLSKAINAYVDTPTSGKKIHLQFAQQAMAAAVRGGK